MIDWPANHRMIANLGSGQVIESWPEPVPWEEEPATSRGGHQPLPESLSSPRCDLFLGSFFYMRYIKPLLRRWIASQNTKRITIRTNG